MTKPNMTILGLKNLRQIGTLVPSSKFLAEKLTQTISNKKDMKILELGGGNGVVTKHILKKLSPGSELVTYELHPLLYKELKTIDDPRLTVVNTCVQKIDIYSENYFDLVISCLPMANFSSTFKGKLMDNIVLIMRNGGTFKQFQYSLTDYLLIKRTFPAFDLNYCLLNIPPAFIYSGKKL